MGAMTNLLVKDDASTPKEWTLVPITDTPNPFWRANDAASPLVGQPRLTLSIETVKNGDYKVSAKSEVPVLETLGASGTAAGYVAPPQVAYTTTVITTMFYSPRSTIGDRANAYRMHVGLLQGASSTTATGTLANTAAGLAWSASSAPLPDFFIEQIIPN
jgi:hypothetical protein